MKKAVQFEYKVFDLTEDHELTIGSMEEGLDCSGEMGWELVQALPWEDGIRLIYKRPSDWNDLHADDLWVEEVKNEA
jgi:hypothetical protein